MGKGEVICKSMCSVKYGGQEKVRKLQEKKAKKILAIVFFYTTWLKVQSVLDHSTALWLNVSMWTLERNTHSYVIVNMSFHGL